MQRYQAGDMNVFELVGFQQKLLEQVNQIFAESIEAVRSSFETIVEDIDQGDYSAARELAATVAAEIKARQINGAANAAAMQAGWLQADQ